MRSCVGCKKNNLIFKDWVDAAIKKTDKKIIYKKNSE
jgi:hypothetical protein